MYCPICGLTTIENAFKAEVIIGGPDSVTHDQEWNTTTKYCTNCKAEFIVNVTKNAPPTY